jgi:hypothetical protein
MDVIGKIIVVSNRNVNSKATDHELFGDDLNPKGSEQLNIALAEKNNEYWELELISNPLRPAYKKPSSFEVFKKAIAQNNGKDWVFFVHGFNQDLKKNLDKCLEIQGYGVNVIAFSWPSNPGPQELWNKPKEYKRAVKNAKRSTIALERCMEKLRDYIKLAQSKTCQINVNMVVHSLGNTLFEEFVRSSTYDNECEIFSNVILHQADADSLGHEHWVDKLTSHTRVFVTINGKDKVLAVSDIVNKNRLGNSRDNCVTRQVSYMDFTNGPKVGTSHRPWHKPGAKVKEIGDFYDAVFHGLRGELIDGWKYNKFDNRYYLD